MNVKDRYKAKQEAKEEAYYKGMEAPQTKMVDTGNGFTQVQTNTDKNGMVNSPDNNKQTTLQNYKPVGGKPVEQPAQQQAGAEVVGNAEVPQAGAEVVGNATETQPAAEVVGNAEASQGQQDEDADITGQVGEVTTETMDKVGINPKNTEQENQKNTENIINKITGNRNKDGTYKPLSKWEYADGIQQFGILATIASIGLAVLTRGAFPPVDFSMFTGLNESYAKYTEGIDNYNKYIRQAQSENAYEAERAEGSQDNADKAAQLNLTTENQQKERDAKLAEYLKNVDALNAENKAKLDHELEVALQDVLTEGQLDVIKANTEAQKAILTIMHTYEVNLPVEQAKAIRDAGLTSKDLEIIAKFAKSQAGQTFYENFLKLLEAGTKAGEAGANLVNSIKGTGSDAGTKDFFKRMVKF